MNITDIRIRRINNAGNLKASASITIDGAFVVHDIKVIETGDAKFIAMPSRRIGETNRFVDIAHPINQQTREDLQAMILEKYAELPEGDAEA
jgi:stage V sporulation protein G